VCYDVKCFSDLSYSIIVTSNGVARELGNKCSTKDQLIEDPEGEFLTASTNNRGVIVCGDPAIVCGDLSRPHLSQATWTTVEGQNTAGAYILSTHKKYFLQPRHGPWGKSIASTLLSF
jgi:hypothetical protein